MRYLYFQTVLFVIMVLLSSCFNKEDNKAMESTESVKNNINIKKEMKKEQQDWIKKIIDYESKFLKKGECHVIASKTKRIIKKSNSRLDLYSLIMGKQHAGEKIFGSCKKVVGKLS